MVEASTTHVSVRQAQTLRGHQAGTSSADCGARGGEQHNRGAELWRNAVPLVCLPPPPPPPPPARPPPPRGAAVEAGDTTTT